MLTPARQRTPNWIKYYSQDKQKLVQCVTILEPVTAFKMESNPQQISMLKSGGGGGFGQFLFSSELSSQ